MQAVNHWLKNLVRENQKIIAECDGNIDHNQDLIYQYSQKLDMYQAEFDNVGKLGIYS